MSKYLILGIMLMSLTSCVTTQPQVCQTKGLAAVYLNLNEAQEVYVLESQGETSRAVARTMKLALDGGRCKPVNEKIEIIDKLDDKVLKVKTESGLEGYMLKSMLDCGVKK